MSTANNSAGLWVEQHPFHALEPVSIEQLRQSEIRTIPQWWIDTQTSSDPVGVALGAWNAAIPGKLPRVMRIIEQAAPTIRLARATLSEGGRVAVVLVYVFGEPYAYYPAAFALAPLPQAELPLFDARVEQGIEAFYTQVQNGFFQEDVIGLMPAQNMPRITNWRGASDFEYVSQHRDPVTNNLSFQAVPKSDYPDIAQLVGVCLDVTGNAVTLDIRDTAGRTWEMWHGGLERVEGTLWDSIDSWIARLFGVFDT